MCQPKTARMRSFVGGTIRSFSFLRLGRIRPSVYRQSADDASWAATRGLMDAEIARVLQGFDVAKLI